MWFLDVCLVSPESSGMLVQMVRSSWFGDFSCLSLQFLHGHLWYATTGMKVQAVIVRQTILTGHGSIVGQRNLEARFDIGLI